MGCPASLMDSRVSTNLRCGRFRIKSTSSPPRLFLIQARVAAQYGKSCRIRNRSNRAASRSRSLCTGVRRNCRARYVSVSPQAASSSTSLSHRMDSGNHASGRPFTANRNLPPVEPSPLTGSNFLEFNALRRSFSSRISAIGSVITVIGHYRVRSALRLRSRRIRRRMRYIITLADLSVMQKRGAGSQTTSSTARVMQRPGSASILAQTRRKSSSYMARRSAYILSRRAVSSPRIMAPMTMAARVSLTQKREAGRRAAMANISPNVTPRDSDNISMKCA